MEVKSCRGILVSVFIAAVSAGAVTSSSRPALVNSRGDTTYYLDAKNGSDDNAGMAPSQAWKTLGRVSGEQFAAGDRLLVAAGTEYHGHFSLHATGKKDDVIRVDRYGEGATPLIAADGLSRSAVLIDNCEYVSVQNLEITNRGKERIADLTGVEISVHNFGTAHDITLSHLYIHDVFGSNVKSAGGGYGILWNCERGQRRSRFDGLVIENNHLVRTDRNGICGGSSYVGRDDWYPSVHVIVRNNLLEDIGGDGIVPIGTDGCIVEHNRINGGRRRAEDYAAGIWPWSADNTIIQFNEVSNYKGTHDGQGYDADWNCRNTLIQYNYSHDNEGGFLLVCDNGASGGTWSAGNVHAVIRYNVSINDGGGGKASRIFHLAGPVRDTQIYNNTIYVAKTLDVPMLLSDSWSGWAESANFTNNIFYVAGSAAYLNDNHPEGLRFLNNLYFGRQPDRPVDEKAIRVDPRFVDPAAGNPQGLRLRDDSPCRNVGAPIPDNGGRDYLGNALPAGGKVNLGAMQ